MFTSLLAQSGDPIAGQSGWAGAGILGLVLAWLLFVHLPGKDKQLKELIDGRDALAKSLTENFDATLTAQRTEFAAQIERLTDHCETEIKLTVDSYLKSIELIRFELNRLQAQRLHSPEASHV